MINSLEAEGREADGREGDGREAGGREADGREGDGREAEGREADGREGDGREGRVSCISHLQWEGQSLQAHSAHTHVFLFLHASLSHMLGLWW